jgi:hypothetical protein
MKSEMSMIWDLTDRPMAKTVRRFARERMEDPRITGFSVGGEGRLFGCVRRFASSPHASVGDFEALIVDTASWRITSKMGTWNCNFYQYNTVEEGELSGIPEIAMRKGNRIRVECRGLTANGHTQMCGHWKLEPGRGPRPDEKNPQEDNKRHENISMSMRPSPCFEDRARATDTDSFNDSE